MKKQYSYKERQLTAFFQNSKFFNDYNNKKIYIDLSNITLCEHQQYRPENKVRSGMEKIQTHVKHTQLDGSNAALIASSFQTLESNWIQWYRITRTEDGAGVSAGRLLFRKQLWKCLGLRSTVTRIELDLALPLLMKKLG